MKRSTAKGCSVTALICSVFPVFTYLLAGFKIVLSPELQTALAGANILCALLGLGLSIACIKSKETRKRGEHFFCRHQCILDFDDSRISGPGAGFVLRGLTVSRPGGGTI